MSEPYDGIQSEAETPPTPGGVELARGVRVPGDAVSVAFSRSSGPGGQNVNKLSTRAELRVALADLAAAGMHPAAVQRLRGLAGSRVTRDDVLILVSQAHRSQEMNRQDAFDKLRELIERAQVVPKARRKTKPSKAAKRRRVDEKRRRGDVKARRQGRLD
jgi:ribosome-associated protein